MADLLAVYARYCAYLHTLPPNDHVARKHAMASVLHAGLQREANGELVLRPVCCDHIGCTNKNACPINSPDLHTEVFQEAMNTYSAQ